MRSGVYQRPNENYCLMWQNVYPVWHLFYNEILLYTIELGLINDNTLIFRDLLQIKEIKVFKLEIGLLCVFLVTLNIFKNINV